MSLKTIELQIAIPRTQDAGKIQHELNERSNLANAQANLSVQKEDEKKRTSVLKNEKSAQLKMDNENKNKDNHEQSPSNQSKKDEQGTVETSHPYKGHFIDFSG